MKSKRSVPPHVLTPRDIQVVLDVHRFRYLSTSLIEMLHFPSRRMANRRLQMLTAHGYLERFRVPAVVGQGGQDYVYCLSREGAALVAARLDLSRDAPSLRRRKAKPHEHLFMDHLLEINLFGACLEVALVGERVFLTTFLAEYSTAGNGARRRRRATEDVVPDPHDPSRSLVVAPDAAFVLEGREGRRALFFLESDRGTEKILSSRYRDFTDKMIAYIGYLKGGGFKRYGEAFSGFRVLVVTTSRTRLANLRRACASLGLERLVWFTTKSQVTPEGVLGRIWQMADPCDDGLYSIAPSRNGNGEG